MLLLRYFLEQPLSLASMSALAVTYITAWCVPITQNGDCGHRQDKALCGKRCTSAIKRKHRIAAPHPTTPHSRHPSGGPGILTEQIRTNIKSPSQLNFLKPSRSEERRVGKESR